MKKIYVDVENKKLNIYYMYNMEQINLEDIIEYDYDIVFKKNIYNEAKIDNISIVLFSKSGNKEELNMVWDDIYCEKDLDKIYQDLATICKELEMCDINCKKEKIKELQKLEQVLKQVLEQKKLQQHITNIQYIIDNLETLLNDINEKYEELIIKFVKMNRNYLESIIYSEENLFKIESDINNYIKEKNNNIKLIKFDSVLSTYFKRSENDKSINQTSLMNSLQCQNFKIKKLTNMINNSLDMHHYNTIDKEYLQNLYYFSQLLYDKMNGKFGIFYEIYIYIYICNIATINKLMVIIGNEFWEKYEMQLKNIPLRNDNLEKYMEANY